MPKCKNSKERYYTGKENTPLGRGFCAHGEAVDKRMKGKDGHMYKVHQTKRGKRWMKAKSMTSPKRNTSPKGPGWSVFQSKCEKLVGRIEGSLRNNNHKEVIESLENLKRVHDNCSSDSNKAIGTIFDKWCKKTIESVKGSTKTKAEKKEILEQISKMLRESKIVDMRERFLHIKCADKMVK